MRLSDTLTVGRQVAALSRSQWWNRAKIENFQRKKLIRTLRYAADHVPYYESLGIDAKLIRSVDDLLRFPILNKALVQGLGDDLISDQFSYKSLYCSRTSGSTGEPTVTFFDTNCWLMCKYALKIRRMTSNGIGIFKHVVIVSEQSPEELRRTKQLPGSGLFFRQTMLSIHDSVHHHLPVFNGQNIDAIYGFPSYFDELIQYCQAHQIRLPSIPIVLTSSEVLQPALRQAIEDFFNARVCDIYGCTELKEVAWQCSKGRYHLNFESVWAETLKSPGATDNEPGVLLLTSLQNKAMPLIRYQVGDFAELNEISCGCGRFAPVIESITGREVDMLLLPGGSRVSPYLLTTEIEASPDIGKYQIFQTARDRIEVAYIRRANAVAVDGFEIVIERMRHHLGPAVSIRFRQVDEIPRTIRGKHRVFVRAPEIT